MKYAYSAPDEVFMVPNSAYDKAPETKSDFKQIAAAGEKKRNKMCLAFIARWRPQEPKEKAILNKTLLPLLGKKQTKPKCLAFIARWRSQVIKKSFNPQLKEVRLFFK